MTAARSIKGALAWAYGSNATARTRNRRMLLRSYRRCTYCGLVLPKRASLTVAAAQRGAHYRRVRVHHRAPAVPGSATTSFQGRGGAGLRSRPVPHAFPWPRAGRLHPHERERRGCDPDALLTAP